VIYRYVPYIYVLCVFGVIMGRVCLSGVCEECVCVCACM